MTKPRKRNIQSKPKLKPPRMSCRMRTSDESDHKDEHKDEQNANLLATEENLESLSQKKIHGYIGSILEPWSIF